MATPGERINFKKRIIKALLDETREDVRLIFDEFEVPEQPAFKGTKEEYIRRRLSDADGPMSSQLDYYLQQKAASDKIPTQDPPMSSLLEGQENTPFSPEEQSRIAEVIAQVLKQAEDTYQLPDDEIRLLEAKLDYLVDVAKHSRRIDWLNTTVGAVAGAFAGGVLAPDVVQKVLTAIGAGLGPLFGHPMPLLSP